MTGERLAGEQALLLGPGGCREVGVDIPCPERRVERTAQLLVDGDELASHGVRLPHPLGLRSYLRPLGDAEAIDPAAANDLLTQFRVVNALVGELVFALLLHAPGALFRERLDRLLDLLRRDRLRLLLSLLRDVLLFGLQRGDDVVQISLKDVGEGSGFQFPVLLLRREHHLHHLGSPASDLGMGVAGVDAGLALRNHDLRIIDALVLTQVLEPLLLKLIPISGVGVELGPQ